MNYFNCGCRFSIMGTGLIRCQACKEKDRGAFTELTALRSENEQWAARVLDMQTQNEALRAELAGLRTGHESLYKEAKGRAVENLELWHKYKGMEGQFANANRLCMERGKELAALKAEWDASITRYAQTVKAQEVTIATLVSERDALKAQLTVKPMAEHRAEQLDWRHAAEVQAQESARLRAALENLGKGCPCQVPCDCSKHMAYTARRAVGGPAEEMK